MKELRIFQEYSGWPLVPNLTGDDSQVKVLNEIKNETMKNLIS